MSEPYATWTAGVVGHGLSEPGRKRTRPDLCAGLGHPGCTYNQQMDRTWCLCGVEQYDGDTAVPHIACCGGPLEESRADPFQPWPSELLGGDES